MPSDLIIDAVRVHSHGREVFVCDAKPRRAPLTYRLYALSALAAALFAAIIFIWQEEAAPRNVLPNSAEIASLVQFSQTISDVEYDLSRSTATFILSGKKAVISNDALAIFDSTNIYSDSLEKLLRRIQQTKLPNTHSASSEFWAKSAISQFERRLEAQYQLNRILVAAADRGEVNERLFSVTRTKAARLAQDECSEISALRRSLESAGVRPNRLSQIECASGIVSPIP